MSYPALKKRKRKVRRAGRCFYCGRQIAPYEATVDHYIPRALGGSNRKENLKPACRPCNQAKGDKLPWEFTPPPRRQE